MTESVAMVLYVKNMVCDRCVRVVREVLLRAGLGVVAVRLGEAEVEQELTQEQKSRLAADLEAQGFLLLEDRRSRIVESVKNAVRELVRSSGSAGVNLSDYLAERLHLDYKYLSSLFSEGEGRTIESYFIAQRIERVKELLCYDELTLSEIAYRLGYSSVAYLSAQFKRVEGVTPSQYKRSRGGRRTLDEV